MTTLLLLLLTQPPTEPAAQSAELVRRAKVRFAQAFVAQKQDKLLEALRLLEEAARLDPAAAAPRQALAPLYRSLGRFDDVFATAKAALERAPADATTWQLLAEELRRRDDLPGSISAWRRGADCPNLPPALQLKLLRGLADALTDGGQFPDAITTQRRRADVLTEQRQRLLETGAMSGPEIDAETARTWEAAGQLHFRTGQFQNALLAYRSALKAAATDADLTGRLSWRVAEVLAAQEKPDEALKLLQQYLAMKPANVDAFALAETLLDKLGRNAEVLPALARYAAADPDFLALHLRHARRLFAERRDAEAARLCERLAERLPSADIFRLWFGVLRERGDAAGALNLLDGTLARSADADAVARPEREAAGARAKLMAQALRADAPFIKQLLDAALREPPQRRDKRAADTLRVLGALAQQTRQLPEAEALYRAAYPRAGDDAQGQLFSGLMQTLWGQRKRADVIELCANELRRRPPRFTRTHLNYQLALAYDGLGRWDDALRSLESSGFGAPGDLNKLYLDLQKVRTLQHAGRHDAALELADRLLKKHDRPDQVKDIRLALASVHGARGERDAAERELRLVLELDPSDPTANNDLGYELADRGKLLDEAERRIRKALDLDRLERQGLPSADGDNAAYLDSLGWVLFRRGKLDEARATLEKAAALPEGAHDPVVWDHLGDVLIHLKKPAEAKAAWAKALPLYETERKQAKDERPAEVRRKLGNE